MVRVHPGSLEEERKAESGKRKGKSRKWRVVPLSAFRFDSVLAEQPGVLATLSRWRSWVQIPSGTLGK